MTLLAHPDEAVWKVGDDLLHSLIDYGLVQQEYTNGNE